MRLDFDFATRSRFASPGFRLLGAAILLLATAVILSAIVAGKNRRLDERISGVEAALVRRQPTPVVRPVIDVEEQKGIRRASAELNVGWDRMLDQFEAARNDAVTLMNVEIESTDASIRVTGTGASYADVLAFVERLSNRSVFYDVLLASHHAVAPAPGSTVQFVVTARWHLQ